MPRWESSDVISFALTADFGGCFLLVINALMLLFASHFVARIRCSRFALAFWAPAVSLLGMVTRWAYAFRVIRAAKRADKRRQVETLLKEPNAGDAGGTGGGRTAGRVPDILSKGENPGRFCGFTGLDAQIGILIFSCCSAQLLSPIPFLTTFAFRKSVRVPRNQRVRSASRTC